MEEISIQKAAAGDIDDILAIEQPCFAEESFSRRQFRYLATRAKGVFYLLKENGWPAAYISVISNARTRRLRIYSVAVHPHAQGKGYAQLLMDKAIMYGKSNRFRSVSLEVKITNTPAIRLYEKNGFEISGIKPHYYSDGSHAYGMIRLLD